MQSICEFGSFCVKRPTARAVFPCKEHAVGANSLCFYCVGLQHELNALKDRKKTKKLKLRPKLQKDNIRNLENFIKHLAKLVLDENCKQKLNQLS